MNLMAFINGQFLPRHEVLISPMDRGFLFGDSLYEVIPVYQGQLFSFTAHLDRLSEGLELMKIRSPYSHQEWRTLLQTLVEKNGGEDQFVYLQVSRGTDPKRTQTIQPETQPTVFAYTEPFPRPQKSEAERGLAAISVSDIRWKYAQIKTCSKLAYVLMAEEARLQGADEALIMHEGYLTEGTSTNVFIVKEGILRTPPKSPKILSGITRDILLQLAHQHHFPVQEVEISESECASADEIWVTSSTRLLRPVTTFNGLPVGDGKAGRIWNYFWELYATELNTFSLPISH